MNYKLTATCPNAYIAKGFVTHWKIKGYDCQMIQEITLSNDGTHMGQWAVYRSTTKIKKS